MILMNYRILIFTILLVVSFGVSEIVLACSCVANISPCQRYGFSDAIFVGKAIGLKKEKARDAKGRENAHELESTIFQVREAVSGVKTQQIIVRNKSGTSCDISFEQGETYLIFANGDAKKGYATGYCSGNTPINSAAEILTALRTLPEAGTGGRLYGNVSESLKKRGNDDYVAMTGVDIKIQEIEGTRKVYQAATDTEGNYELIVPQGKYKVTPSIPTYARLGLFSEEPVIVKDRGCVDKNFTVENKSQIKGKVIDGQGKPIAEIYVELVSIDGEKPGAFSDNGGYTDKIGNFSITSIPSGRYTLSINYLTEPDEDRPFPTFFYPNAKKRDEAIVIKVGLGQTISNLILQLPARIAKRKIYGTVVFPDGRPAAGMTVNLQRRDSDISFSYTETDKNGNFVLNGFIGEQYNFGINYYGDEGEKREYSVKKSVFMLDENTRPFRLVLEKSKEGRIL